MTVIERLELQPHPEGGHFRETWRDAPVDGSRGSGTAILYLLASGERSHWHRVDADELWHFHAGSSLRLEISDGTHRHESVLGMDLAAGERPQLLAPAGQWQAAETRGAWTLVSCTVSPAFRYEGFELAPVGWEPG